MAVRTARKRSGVLAIRGLMFYGALLAIPFGLYGVVAQHAVGAGVAMFFGLVCLALWWVLRPRFASAPARRLAVVCALLTMAVAAAAVIGVVEFFRSPASGASATSRMPAIIAAAIAIVLLAVRIFAGHRLRAVAALDATMAPGAVQPETVGAPAGGASAAGAPQSGGSGAGVDSFGRKIERLPENEISELQQRWRDGQYQSTQCLTVQPDGTLVLRPQRMRVRGWHLGSIGVLPFALLAVARVFLTSGWVGLLVVAASVAAILLALLGLYEMKIRHGAAVLTATEVIIPTWYGRRRSVPRSAVTRVVLVRQRVPRQATAAPQLLLLGGDGTFLLRLATASIPREDVLAFAAALQVFVEVKKERVDPRQLKQEYPGSVPWVVSNPAAAGLLIALIIVIIVVAVVVGLAATGVIQGSSGQPG
jgi:hypothetical protein